MDAVSQWKQLTDHPWSFFVTLTFTDETSEARASKMWLRLMNKLAKQTMSCRAAKASGLAWVRGVERHELGGAHVHGLVTADCKPADVVKLWQSLAGGSIIECQPFDVKRKDEALRYVTKCGDIDVSNKYFKP